MQKASVARMAVAVPQPDVESLTKTCMDLKQAVEQMAGRFDSVMGQRARMTVSATEPKIASDGEFWLTEGVSNILSVSYGGKWRKVGPVS